jgi:hypothetical protein
MCTSKPSEPAAAQLTALLASHGFTCRVEVPTHQLGGLLDVVATRDDLPVPTVLVDDIGLSDHYLLHWSTPFVRPEPVYTTSVRRPWRRIGVDDLRDAIRASALGRPELLPVDTDVDRLATLYDRELLAIADRLAPARTVTVRRRQSDSWFDEECRAAKCTVRAAERLARRSQSAPDVASWSTKRRAYRDLLRTKRESFWRSMADAARGRPRDLWSTFDRLLGRGRAPVSDTVSAPTFHAFFEDKVDAVRGATADASPPSFQPAVFDCQLSSLGTVTVAEVTTAIMRLPDKQCSSDILPTWLFKSCAEELSPFLAQLFTRSFAAGTVPLSYKAAYVTPLLKKPDLDPADVRSHRPISNLSVVSKLQERLVAGRLTAYLTSNGLMPSLQSAFRANHSTETAVLLVLSDILRALDRGDLASLTLLDLSAAFDTVDHDTVIAQLH